MDENKVKLKKAMEEIKAIIEKYDVAGVVNLHAPGHGEFYQNLTPSYSVLLPQKDEQGVLIGYRFRSRSEDYEGDKKKQRQGKEDTINMLQIFQDTFAFQFKRIDQVLQMLSKHIDFK